MSQQAQAVVQTQQKTLVGASPKSDVSQRAAVISHFAPVHSGILQRCTGGVECAECREKRERREVTMQRVAVNAAPANSVPSIVHEVLSSSGQSLDAGTRAFMEPRFGYDFSGVRVHTDARATKSARAVNALAYTVGNDVVFAEGEYEPGTSEGRRLLAHELTHVVQQGNRPFSAGRAMTLGTVGDTHEQMADRVANAIVTGHPAELTLHINNISPSVIQRQPLTQKGDVGCPVPELQDALNATGEALVVDGRFGNLTDATVRRFQTAHPPLVVDGLVGPSTWSALHAAAPGDHGLPAGELTNSVAWGAGANATIHQWRQQLTPVTTNFHHCKVTEADPGGGTDTCWFPGSAFAPFTAVTGGTWDVQPNNFWGNDFVGWFTGAVTYYRAHGRAPCQASWPQSMRVVRPSGNVEYQQHQLISDIGTTTVSSTRAGQTQTRVWP